MGRYHKASVLGTQPAGRETSSDLSTGDDRLGFLLLYQLQNPPFVLVMIPGAAQTRDLLCFLQLLSTPYIIMSSELTSEVSENGNSDHAHRHVF